MQKSPLQGEVTPDQLSSLQADLVAYSAITAVSNVYTIPLANRPMKNVKITTADANAKTVTLTGIPAECEIFVELTYTNAAAITWFSGITWLSGSAPTLTAGKVYRMAFFTANGGTTWHGQSVGGW